MKKKIKRRRKERRGEGRKEKIKKRRRDYKNKIKRRKMRKKERIAMKVRTLKKEAKTMMIMRVVPNLN